MISALPWLLYIYILCIQNVIGVRIFQNVLPVPMPTKFVEYEPDVLSKTCLLKPDAGPCRGNINMLYYEPEIKNCTSFIWGGCQGNGNRFNTREDCLTKCLSRQGGPKRRPKWCALTFDYGFCFGSVKRYYFDNLWKVCKATVYSGCGGNRNNFYSHEQCESVCLYGNGPVTLPDKHVTAPTKILIINPTQARARTKKSQNADQAGGNGNGNGNNNNGVGNVGNANANAGAKTGNGNGNGNQNRETAPRAGEDNNNVNNGGTGAGNNNDNANMVGDGDLV